MFKYIAVLAFSVSILTTSVFAENSVILGRKIKLSGNITIIGNICSTNEIDITGNPKVLGEINKNIKFQIPEIDISNFTKINKGFHIKDDVINGLFYVQGKVKIAGSTSGEIVIIAEDDIDISGKARLTSFGKYLLISKKGKIKISGDAVLKGKIIAEEIKISGNVKIIDTEYQDTIIKESEAIFRGLGIEVEGTPADLQPETQQEPEQIVQPIIPPSNTENLLKEPPQPDKPFPDPWKYSIQYTLKEDAEVYVTIINQRRIPVNTFAIQPGEEGSRRGENRLILWLGRDQDGQEMPEGRYYAFQVIKYPNGEEEIKIYPLEK